MCLSYTFSHIHTYIYIFFFILPFALQDNLCITAIYFNPSVCSVRVTWKINYEEQINHEKMNKHRRKRNKR